ncbi:Uma2 family endonuclease [Streptomyces sp. NPDC049954]|uniref:Uma2 family endonuclease n=1 Tax=Streptomyces sp. NPDC049954 TaxID=3155779 RepID=UPI00341D8570
MSAPLATPPGWTRPPRPEGWFAEDLDRLPEAPRHTELIDGALVFVVSPQRWWHGEVVTDLTLALREQAPAGFRVGREMTMRLDARNRPEPDLVVTTAPYEPDRTWFAPEDVQLVVEVVSPESAHRDRTVKLRKYAGDGRGAEGLRARRPGRERPGRRRAGWSDRLSRTGPARASPCRE